MIHDPIHLSGVHGTRAFPVVLRNLNIDAEFKAKPLSLYKCSHIIIDNVSAVNGNHGCVEIQDCQNISVHNITARNATRGFTTDNQHVVHIIKSQNVLVEDCNASGHGRKAFEVYQSEDVIVRRLKAYWQGHLASGGCVCFGYRSRRILFDDCDAVIDLRCENLTPIHCFAVDHGFGLNGESLEIELRNSRAKLMIGAGGSIVGGGGSPQPGRCVSIQSGVEHSDIAGGITIDGITVEAAEPHFGLYLDHRPSNGKTVTNTIRNANLTGASRNAIIGWEQEKLL